MLARTYLPLLSSLARGPQASWIRAALLPPVLSPAQSSMPAAGRNASRTILGTTAGTAILVFTGSILAWPIADLCLGPRLVLWGMTADPSQTGDLRDSPVASSISLETTITKDPRIVVVSGVPGAGRQLEHIAASSERLVVYVSLQEATSPHDLYFAMISGIYSKDRLGGIGTFAHSMGVWWIILFDIVVGYEPEKTRAINFSVVLQHLRRALRAAHADLPLDAPRPLVIFDHIEEAISHKDDFQMRSMLAHLMSWCTATCYADGLSDIVLCDETAKASWRRSSKGDMQNLHDSAALKTYLKKRWSL